MSLKSEYLKSATLGTSRAELPALKQSGKVSELLAALKSAYPNKELFLSHALAVLTVYEKVGRKPLKYQGDFPQPAEPEQQNYLSGSAAALLAMILEHKQDLLPELLELSLSAQKVLPPEFLLELIELARKKAEIRDSLIKCGGKRILFLAASIDSYKFLLETDEYKLLHEQELKEKFDFGQRQERHMALLSARKKDPSFARELLETSWSEESLADRQLFLSALSENLNAADAPFLERLLNERSKEIRKEALNMLLKLPDSNLAKRNEYRLKSVLQFERTSAESTGFLSAGNGRAIVRVNTGFCAELERELQKDGFSINSPDARMGENAWLLCQIVSATDPAKLPLLAEFDQLEILSAFAASEWRVALLLGLEAAVYRFRNSSFAELLLMLQFSMLDFQVDRVIFNHPLLYQHFDAEKHEQFLQSLIENRGFMLAYTQDGHFNGQLLDLLRLTAGPWSRTLSLTVLKALRKHMSMKNLSILGKGIMQKMAISLDLRLWSEIEESWLSCARSDHDLAGMFETLSMRKAIKEAIAES